MVQKKKNLLLLCSTALIGILGVVTAEIVSTNGAFAFMFANANVDTYTLTLNKNNAPTTGGFAHHEVRTTSGATLDLTYEGASESATGHVTLAENGFIKFNSRVTGLYSVTPIFTGELTASFGLENDTLATQTLASGQEIYLAEGYYFNHVKLIAESATEVSSLVFKYTCSEAVDQITNPTVWTSNGGAIVRGINDVTYLGENVYLRVEPFMDNTIESVKLNGKELTLDPTTKTYVYQAGLEDNIQIQTSLKDKITAHMYTIDPETGASTYLEDRELAYTVSADGYSYTVNAPTLEGWSPNQDYIKSVLDSEHQEVSFYYSKVSQYDPSLDDPTDLTLEGAGTAASPYLVKTANDWVTVGRINYATATDKNYYKMTRTLDFSTLTNQALLRIGGTGRHIRGTFDGNNCAVRGINAIVGETVTPTNYTTPNALTRFSLFYCINTNTGILKNLSTYGYIKAGVGTGGLVCYAEAKSQIINCNNYIEIDQAFYSSAWSGSANAVGGIAGSIKGGTLTNCTNYGDVTNTTPTYTSGSTTTATNKTAGIAGVVEGTNSVMNNVFNFGNVSGSQFVCGIVPFANDEMTLALNDVYNFGSVHGETSNPSGIIGAINLRYIDINGAYNFGNVTAGAGITSYAGVTLQVHPGIEGTNYSIDNAYNFADFTFKAVGAGITSFVTETNLGQPAVFNNCRNYGDILSTFQGDTFIGGIVGRSYNLKDGIDGSSCVAEFNDCQNYGYIDGYRRVGGLVGAVAIATINNSANYGDVGTRDGSTSTSWNGGLVGTSYNNEKYKKSFLTVNNSANFGNVKVSGDAAGGIVGSPSGNANTSINGCANYGRITAFTHAAGIVGFSSTGAVGLTLTNSVNYGRILATSGYAAGVLGNPITDVTGKNWTVTGNYNYGIITAPTKTGDVIVGD